MHEHLLLVQEIQRKGKPEAWVTMDFPKAFDTVSQVQAQTLHLTGVMAQYARYTGQAPNLAKSKAVI